MAEAARKHALVAQAQRHRGAGRGARVLAQGVHQAVVGVGAVEGGRGPEHHFDALDVLLHHAGEGPQRQARGDERGKAGVVHLQVLRVEGAVEAAHVDARAQHAAADVVHALLSGQQFAHVEGGQLVNLAGVYHADGGRGLGQLLGPARGRHHHFARYYGRLSQGYGTHVHYGGAHFHGALGQLVADVGKGHLVGARLEAGDGELAGVAGRGARGGAFHQHAHPRQRLVGGGVGYAAPEAALRGGHSGLEQQQKKE